MASVIENLKNLKPLVDTGLEIFATTSTLNVTNEMKQQRKDFLQQFPRTTPPTRGKKRKVLSNLEEELRLNRTIVAMFQNELIAQAHFIEKLQVQLQSIQNKLIS
jgi:hypothetical protein